MRNVFEQVKADTRGSVEMIDTKYSFIKISQLQIKKTQMLLLRLSLLLLGSLVFSGNMLWAKSRFSPEEQENIQIYKMASKAVVNISSIAYNYDFYLRATPREKGSGTGFFFNNKGHILTNFHVIENAQKLTVTLADNSQWTASVVGVDPSSDLAVLHVKVPNKLYSKLELADSSQIMVGQKVLALGNPFGLRQTLTTGIVSALGRTIKANNGRKIEGVIQSDAAINPGNSGGPLLDRRSKVIGINTAIIGSAGSVGIGFSIPSNTARSIIPDLVQHGYVRRPWLGIDPIPTSNLTSLGFKVPKGLLVVRVVRNSAAGRAGLRGATRELLVNEYIVPWGGDIVTHIDNKAVLSFEDLKNIVEAHNTGDRVEIRYVRKGKRHKATVKLTQRPRP